MNLRHSLFFTLVAPLLISPAMAAPMQAPTGSMGQPAPPIVISEAHARIEQQAKALDANGDGMIDAEEFSRHQEQRRAQAMQTRFAEMDTNHDGVIDAEEFATAHSAMQQKRASHRRADHTPIATDTFIAERKERLTAMDKDGDGIISQEEFQNRRLGPGKGSRGARHDRPMHR